MLQKVNKEKQINSVSIRSELIDLEKEKRIDGIGHRVYHRRQLLWPYFMLSTDENKEIHLAVFKYANS